MINGMTTEDFLNAQRAKSAKLGFETVLDDGFRHNTWSQEKADDFRRRAVKAGRVVVSPSDWAK